MEKLVQDTHIFDLKPLHEKILYAEKHRKNYDIHFSVKYDQSLAEEKLDSSIQYVMNSIEAFKGKIIQKGSRYCFSVNNNYSQINFRSDQSLKNTKINIFNEELLARYYIDESKNTVEFLFHHLIFDGDSLYAFLGQLEEHIIRDVPLTFPENSYFQMEDVQLDSNRINKYVEKIKGIPYGRNTGDKLKNTRYTKLKISEQAYKAVNSLSHKLRITKFGVLLFATALLGEKKNNLLGVVVSRKDKINQAKLIGNFTDIVPYALQIDVNRSYLENAKNVFKELFYAIEHSNNLSYEQYMNIIGGREYDFVISYTKMNDLEQQLSIFSDLELGEYLYKFDNHLQFNEYKNYISAEFRYNNIITQGICERLEGFLLELDNINFSGTTTLEVNDQITEKSEGELEEIHSLDSVFFKLDEEKNIFDVGISSLEIAKIITDVYDNFGVQLSYQDIYSLNTIGELKKMVASRINDAQMKESEDICSNDSYPLPNFLKAIFIDSFRFIGSEMYNVKYAFKLTEEVNKHLGKFQCALEKVMKNNDIFFTKFEYAKGNIVGQVQENRVLNVEYIDVDELKDINEIKSNIQIQGIQKLWDIKLIRIVSTNEYYLYINMHHMLIDNIGIRIFLSQIEAAYKNQNLNFAQYRNVAKGYEVAKQEDLKNWRKFLDNHAYENLGKPILTNGKFNLYTFECDLKNMEYDEIERSLLTNITNILARHFGYTKGYIGAVYHGRIVPYSDQVINSFARTLPIFFDARNEKVIKESLLLARQNQAVSIYDLNESGFSLEFPRIVFQTLISNVEKSNFFEKTIELEGISKFQIFFNLQIDDGKCLLNVYIDPYIYRSEEEKELISAIGNIFENSYNFVGEITNVKKSV